MRHMASFAFVLLATSLFAQSKPSKNYNINYGADQLKGRYTEPKVVFFQGIIAGRTVDFSVAVVEGGNALSVTFSNSSVIVSEAADLSRCKVKSTFGEILIDNGLVDRRGSGRYVIDISSLPKGNYVLSIDNLNSGQSITFSNY